MEIPVDQWKYIGFQNYRLIAIEGNLGVALYKTILYAVVGSTMPMILGMLYALLVNSFSPRVRRIVSNILIIPMLILPVAIAISWSFF